MSQPLPSSRRLQGTGRGGGAPRQTKKCPTKRDFLFGSTRRSTTPCSDGRPASSGASTDRSSICSAARCRTPDGCPDRTRRIRRPPVQRRSPPDSSTLPAVLRKATPRDVRVNVSGGIMLATAAVLVAAGMWGGIVLGRRAETAERHLGLFTSERIVTAGDVIQLQKRGGGNDHRITAHYRYT